MAEKREGREEESESNANIKNSLKFMAKPDECLTPSVCLKPMMSLMSFGISNTELFWEAIDGRIGQ